jgi:hypothetical protein
MNRTFNALASSTLVAGVTLTAAGCGSGTPPLETPNNTLEHAIDNMNYGPILMGHTPTETIHVTLPAVNGVKGRETLDIWNYTQKRVNPTKVKAIGAFLVNSVAEVLHPYTFPIHYDDGTTRETITISSYAVQNYAREHDMFLVPADEAAPANFDQGTSMTEYLDLMQPSEPASESIVYRASHDNGSLESFFGPDSGFSTEMCQSEVSAIPITTASSSKLQMSILDRLSQETLCNSIGTLINAVLGRLSFSAYRSYVQEQQGTVSDDDGDTWQINEFAVSNRQYAHARRELVGAKR